MPFAHRYNLLPSFVGRRPSQPCLLGPRSLALPPPHRPPESQRVRASLIPSTKTSEQLSTFTSFSRASTSLSSISTPTIMSGLSKTPTASPKASKKSPGPFCPSCTSSPSPSSDETKTLASQNPQPRSDPASRMKNELLPATPTAETKIQPSSTRRPPLRPPADVLASRRPSPSLASYKPLNDVQQKTLERDQCSIERESEREEQEETPERKKQREELDTARGSLGEEQRDVLKRVISGESVRSIPPPFALRLSFEALHLTSRFLFPSSSPSTLTLSDLLHRLSWHRQDLPPSTNHRRAFFSGHRYCSHRFHGCRRFQLLWKNSSFLGWGRAGTRERADVDGEDYWKSRSARREEGCQTCEPKSDREVEEDGRAHHR
jgi:hypothetical protein